MRNIFDTFYFFIIKKGKMLYKSKKKICRVHGEDALTRQIAAKWFYWFQGGNFDIKNIFLVDLLKNVSEIFQKIEENRHESSYDIAKELIDPKTILVFA